MTHDTGGRNSYLPLVRCNLALAVGRVAGQCGRPKIAPGQKTETERRAPSSQVREPSCRKNPTGLAESYSSAARGQAELRFWKTYFSFPATPRE